MKDDVSVSQLTSARKDARDEGGELVVVLETDVGGVSAALAEVVITVVAGVDESLVAEWMTRQMTPIDLVSASESDGRGESLINQEQSSMGLK